jgi:hypothetical protein
MLGGEGKVTVLCSEEREGRHRWCGHPHAPLLCLVAAATEGGWPVCLLLPAHLLLSLAAFTASTPEREACVEGWTRGRD